jgi:hypothetical protein
VGLCAANLEACRTGVIAPLIGSRPAHLFETVLNSQWTDDVYIVYHLFSPGGAAVRVRNRQ